MNNRDKFEAIRAEQARQWLNHPDRIIEDMADRQRRIKADIKAGHSPLCSLIKCHTSCKKKITDTINLDH